MSKENFDFGDDGRKQEKSYADGEGTLSEAQLDILRRAALVEQGSDHPLAQAVVKGYPRTAQTTAAATAITITVGTNTPAT